MIGNAKKWKTGTLSLPVQLPSGEQITLFAEKGEQTGNTFAVHFSWSSPLGGEWEGSFAEILDAVGELPIPPYLNRKTEESDKTTYQTVYSRIKGSVAAPTAGLHFSRELLKRLEIKDVKMAEVTLHAGLGNFKPIEVEDLTKHRMDSEEMYIDDESCDLINNAKANGKKICAVGTTSMKVLETAVTIPGKVRPYSGWTNKFIYPPYDFSVADMMITNFHPSLSSMFIMVTAFVGYDLMMKAYQTAIKEKYKFYTYGDAMLIL
jgi:S-adenosylmethionine:tRNA ribosyltransferase-isomerase